MERQVMVQTQLSHCSLSSHVERFRLRIFRSPYMRGRSHYMVLAATAVEESSATSAWTQRISPHRKCLRFSDRGPALGRIVKHGQAIQ